MNDKVETIYTQMFAPHPIPQSVLDLYARAKFLADRIDNPNISVGGLVLIAAIATKSAKSSISKPIEPAEIDTDTVSETLSVKQDAVTTGATVLAPQTPPEQTPAPRTMDAPLGLMDAPATPEPALQRGMSEKRLMLLTPPELRAHAKEFYDLDAKKNWGKRKIVHVIHAMSPIKPGAQAKRPSEVNNG